MSGSYLSIPTLVRCFFRPVANASSPRLYRGAAPSPTVGLRDELLANARTSDLTVRFLAEMDRKLDAIMTLLQRDSLAVDFPLQGHVVELSGEGLLLECEHPFAPGTYAELVLMLEEYPMRLLSVLAYIDGVLEDRKALTATANAVYSVRFSEIEEEDRESVIRFVFGEQRKQIRQQKSDL